MPSPNFGSGLDRIQYRREVWSQTIVIAVILAFLINLATSALFNALFEDSDRMVWLWRSIPIFVLIVVCLGFVYLGMSRKYEPIAIRELQLILPIHVDPGQRRVGVVTHGRYWLARKSNELLSSMDRALKDRFTRCWISENPVIPEQFVSGRPCWDTLALLLEASLLQWINRHSKDTLRKGANFRRRYRHVAGQLAGREYPSTGEANPFAGNPFMYVKGNTSNPFIPVYIPQSASLERHQFGQEACRPTSSLLKLVTPYGTVSMEISPYWMALSGRRLENALAFFKVKAPRTTTLLEIPMEVRLDIRGLPICPQKRLDAEWHYKWLYQLMDEMDRELDCIGIMKRGKKRNPLT